jgi:hypothetical protein
MDDKLLQCFALVTGLVSAVAAVLAFTQSGWRNTVRATVFVLGAGSVAYLFLLPEREPPASRDEGLPAHSPVPPQVSAAVPRPTESLPSVNIPSSAQVDHLPPPSSRRPAASEILPAPVPGLQRPRSAFPTAVASASSSILSLLDLVGTPMPLPYRYPSVYLPSEVIECPHCRTPYSASDSGRRVRCPACAQIVDLVPSGRYFTIHCCCGNWLQSPYQCPEDGMQGTSQQIPYFCPRCRAQGTITRSTGRRRD